MSNASDDRKTGCGLLNAVFGRKWPRRCTSTGSFKTANVAGPHLPRIPSTPNSRRQKGLDEASFLEMDRSSNKQVDRIIARPAPNNHQHHKTAALPPVHHNHQPPQARKAADHGVKENIGYSYQGYNGQNRKVPQGSTGISGELESMINDHQRSKGASNLVRASSGNVMLYGNLGNLRQPGGQTVDSANNNHSAQANAKYSNSVMGNVVKKSSSSESTANKPTSLCRAISTRMDPEELKIMGNEDYKNGRFAEALALYEAAISIDPDKASYRSNKSAALTALGRLLEAVFECREAIRIEPSYQRAHNRLATLYLRLGEAEKAMYHYKHAGAEADPEVLTKAKTLQVHLNRCTEAKMQRDWNMLIKQTTLAISAAADSAPQIFALKAEALLKIHRHQEAEEVISKGPSFDVEECTKFFGPIGHAGLLVIQAQVDLVAGRFDDALAAAQRAARLDSNNKEANAILRRTRALAAARSNGNDLFKAGKYSEACVAYGDGLDHDPYNSVLLCNRAACRSKLGQFDQAIEDCTAALNIRPSYSKARLRRADCYAKLGKWEASVQDYEVLSRESPEDEEVSRAFKEAREQLRKHGGGRSNDVTTTNSHGHDVITISQNERFRDYITSPGISVALFCNKSGDKLQTLHFMEQLKRKYSSVNFLKVEVEENPSLARTEGVSLVPVWKLYKNGSRMKDIQGNSHELLESTIKYYIAS